MSRHPARATLTDLLARTRAAKGPSKQIDWLIAEAFEAVPEHTVREIGFDYEWWRRPGEYTLWKATDSEGRNVTHWSPKPVSGSVDAALAFAEQVLGKHWRYELRRGIECRCVLWYAEGDWDDRAPPTGYHADHMPLAIIAAVLAALMEMMDD